MLKILLSLIFGFCLALSCRLAIDYGHASERDGYLGQLCTLAQPSLQTGSRREVVEFLSSALRMRYPAGDIKVVMSEAGDALVVDGLRSDLNAQYDCPVGGRIGVVLGFRYKSPTVFNIPLVLWTILAAISVYALIEVLIYSKSLVERYAIASFESVLAQKLNLSIPGRKVGGFFTRILNVDSPALTEINASVTALQATIASQSAALAEGEKNAAVASMTGMLAHDVRKPFSILRMGLGMLGKAKDPAAVKRILAGLVPEIDKAVSSVDGLIADVMEVGSTSTQLIQEPASPESLIEATLGEAFRIYSKADISISYDLRHVHMVNVHVQKVGRVFSNIVGNAVQAMGYKGEMWFKTRERDGLIEFCLGNAGSVIPAESLPKLFDAFFTSGKKGGTGLGLAIAQKVVTAHGGRIWCDSSKTMEHPEGKVEFFFTLPVADRAKNKTTANLPKHSYDISRAITAMAAATETGEGSVDRGELTLEVDIVQASAQLGRTIQVLVVDDEPIYRGGLAAYLSRTPELEAAIALTQVDGSNAAISAMGHKSFDLLITDVDMGRDSVDGFDLVRQLRADSHSGMVCVHSNRIVGADHKRAIDAGAEAFLPKPMARAQLLRLVLQALQAAPTPAFKPAEPVSLRQGAVVADQPQIRPEIAVVDDNPFILDAWEDVLKSDAIVHVFAGLEDLTDRLDADPGFAGRLIAAITDMHLDGSAGDGLDVGRLLKKNRPDLPVLLSSDGVFAADELTGAVDRIISKNPVNLRGLELA